MASTVPDTDHGSNISPLRLVLRAARFAWLVLISVLLIPFVPLMGRRAPAVVRWWYRRMLHMLDVEVCVHGEVPQQAALIVTNHSTWMDIFVLGHVFDTVFISKAEVGQWPIVGVYARTVGTLFLARGAHRTEDTRQQIRSTFEHNRSVVLFPEGTTSRTPVPTRFHARLFSAALDGSHPVLPVALRYSDADTPPGAHHPSVPWVDAPVLANFRQVFRLRGLRVDVAICPLIESEGHDRRSLARASLEAIRQKATPSAAD